MNNEIIYFDNAATTRPLNKVATKMSDVMLQTFGNPSSLHRLGVSAAEQLSQARKRIASFCNVSSEWIYFTSGATESNQTVLLKGTRNPNKRRNHILISSIEHPSSREAIPLLEEKGYEVELLQPNKEGLFEASQIAQKIRPTTEMVSLIGIHNELGSKQNIVQINQTIKALNPKTLFHVDGVQWFGKYPLPSESQMPDFFTFAAHKFHGPRGIGGIIKKPQVDLKPFLTGGGQEKGIRSGTENLPAIAGMAEALSNHDMEAISKKNQALQQELYDWVLETKPLIWIGPPPGATRTAYICLFSLPGKKSEILIHQLEEKNIFISSGSACSEKSKSPSAKWDFLQLNELEKDGILRVSFGRHNTLEELTIFITELKKLL